MPIFKSLQNRYWDMLFVITILFFILSMIHIIFAWIGLLCMVLPFILYYRSKEKIWCKHYCPRASFLKKSLGRISLGMQIPPWMTTERIKKVVVYYFGINIFFAAMSTTMVSLGRIDPFDYVRILMIFKAPFTLPQVFHWHIHPGLLHASYRVYSMVFTSTLIGFLLGLLYRPRTWCMICPIQTLTSGRGTLLNRSAEKA